MATISVYEAVGRNLGDVVAKCVPTNATGTTVESNTLIHPLADQLKGHEMYIFEGSGEGQARVITVFDEANNRITVDPAFSTIPSINSTFLVFRHFATEDYENAMNRIMGKAKLVNLVEKVATMQLVGSQYEYAVPSGFEYISGLRLVPSGHSDYESDDEIDRIFELPMRAIRIEPNAGGSFLIVIDPRKISIDANLDKAWAKVIGQVKPDFAASSIPDNLQEYIISGASMLLASQRMSGAQNDPWYSKFRLFRDQTTALEEYVHRPRYGKRVGA